MKFSLFLRRTSVYSILHIAQHSSYAANLDASDKRVRVAMPSIYYIHTLLRCLYHAHGIQNFCVRIIFMAAAIEIDMSFYCIWHIFVFEVSRCSPTPISTTVVCWIDNNHCLCIYVEIRPFFFLKCSYLPWHRAFKSHTHTHAANFYTAIEMPFATPPTPPEII